LVPAKLKDITLLRHDTKTKQKSTCNPPKSLTLFSLIVVDIAFRTFCIHSRPFGEIEFTFFMGLFSLLLHILFIYYLDKADCFYGRNTVEEMMVHVHFFKLHESITGLVPLSGLLRELIPLNLF